MTTLTHDEIAALVKLLDMVEEDPDLIYRDERCYNIAAKAGAMLTALQARARESALEALAAYGQAAEAHTAQLAAEARVKELEGALQPFAAFSMASSFEKLPDDLPMTQGSRMAHRQVTAGDFKRARAALPATDKKGE